MAQSQRDVIEILTHDHREVEQMFAELEGLRGVTDEQGRTRRKDLVDQATIELVRHSVAEEAEVYPLVKEKVSEAEAERAKQEHAEAEITMKRLESLQPGDPAFDEQLATLMREIREHVAEEEGQMFRHMRTIFSVEELMEMGAKVERVKKMAPTRAAPLRTGPAARRQGARTRRRPFRSDARCHLWPRHRRLSQICHQQGPNSRQVATSTSSHPDPPRTPSPTAGPPRVGSKPIELIGMGLGVSAGAWAHHRVLRWLRVGI